MGKCVVCGKETYKVQYPYPWIYPPQNPLFSVQTTKPRLAQRLAGYQNISLLKGDVKWFLLWFCFGFSYCKVDCCNYEDCGCYHESINHLLDIVQIGFQRIVFPLQS